MATVGAAGSYPGAIAGAGSLDQVITLRRRPTDVDGTPTVDALGQTITTWIEGPFVFARIRPLRGGEAVSAAAHTDGEIVEVTIRYRILDTTWGFLWRGRHYDITSVAPIGGIAQDLRLLATSGGKDHPV